MALSATAVVSLAELKRELGIPDSKTDLDDRLADDAIEPTTEELEASLDRFVVNRATTTSPYVEYHSIDLSTQELRLRDSPVLEVLEVAEDSDWQGKTSAARYGTALVAGTDYVLAAPSGRILRVGTTWARGLRAVRVKYRAGYATTADVPAFLKRTALDVCARIWRESQKKEWGVSSVQDSSGSITRFVPATLTAYQRERLRPWRRVDYRPTWERDDV